MSTATGAQPAPVPRKRRSSGRGNPDSASPADVLFIFAASVFLLLLLMWMASSLKGRPLFADLPAWLKESVSGVWAKLASGLVGAGALAWRKYFYGTRARPNYLLWIPVTTFLLLGALYAAERLVPEAPPAQVMGHLPIRFAVQVPERIAKTGTGTPIIAFAMRSPVTRHPQAILPDKDPAFPYYYERVDVPLAREMNFFAELNPIFGGVYDAQFTGHVYEICLKANPKHPFPAGENSDAAGMLEKLTCLPDGTCRREGGTPDYAVACEESSARWFSLTPVVYAATQQPKPEPGWVVPSLDTLGKMPGNARPGYTRFEVKFTPQGDAARADHYFYLLKINGQPVYVDGFLPDRFQFPLQSGPNWISFALENLNFTGQDYGFENLHLSVVFLSDGKEVARGEVERKYVALRDATTVPPVHTAAGTFEWTGKYVPASIENKYEILLASSECSGPLGEACVKNTVRAKNQFDAESLQFDDRRVVMIIRPPLRPNKPAYGLALGVVQPTSQVKFTFNAQEADQLCHWAAQQVGEGKAGRVIRPDLNRYEVTTRGYKRCQ